MAVITSFIIHYSSRKRLILYLLSGIMLLGGIIMLLTSFSNKSVINSGTMIFGIILLLGFLALTIIGRKLFVNKIAMTVDDDGLTDNASSGYTGFIPWGDVTEVKKKKVNGRRVVCVFVNNPNDYIKKGNSLIQRKQMDFYKTNFDTPIVISSRGLDLDYFALLEVIQRKYNLYNAMEEEYLPKENSSIHL